jgi:hypothetical protein
MGVSSKQQNQSQAFISTFNRSSKVIIYICTKLYYSYQSSREEGREAIKATERMVGNIPELHKHGVYLYCATVLI